MADIITRKCAKCKGEIEIDIHDIRDVIYFNKLYYHESCFEETAKQKAMSKRGKPQVWQEALDGIWELEADTKKMLEHFYAKDELNAWLLDNYDIVAVPSYLWQLIADLENGKYKNKKCNPISITTLYSMWKWGQKNLNKIAANNKSNRKGPKNDNDRLRYDLAILLSHTNDYMTHITRSKEEVAEITTKVENAKKFDYEKIYHQSKKQKQQDNILDIMDDIF